MIFTITSHSFSSEETNEADKLKKEKVFHLAGISYPNNFYFLFLFKKKNCIQCGKKGVWT